MGRKRRFCEVGSFNRQNKRRRKSIFNINNIVETDEFKTIKRTMNQEQYYRLNNSSKDILKIVKLSNKAFGEKIQCIIQELLNMDKPDHTGHDAQYESLKFEIKSSRYGVRNKDFTWQHIMEKHDYDYLILVGVDFDALKVFIISKTKFIKLKKKEFVKTQGGGEGQGLWCKYKNIEEYLCEIRTNTDFHNYIDIE